MARILVVDDTPTNVKLLADLLTAKGHAVATATSGVEALAEVQRDRPDLVLLDVMMPGLNGYDVCRKLREDPATSLLPVVMVTALVILVLSGGVRRRFEQAIDRRFFREKYKFDQAMRKMSQAVDRLVDRGTLGRRLLEAAAR